MGNWTHQSDLLFTEPRPIAIPDRYVRGRLQPQVSPLSPHATLLGSSNKSSQSDLFTYTEWNKIRMAPRSTDISKQKRKKDRKNVLAGRRVSGLLWFFFVCVWQNKTLPSRRPLWDGSPTSVTSVIISRCFTVRGEKQVKCHRPREGNHGWLLRWWPFSPRPNVKFVHLS